MNRGGRGWEPPTRPIITIVTDPIPAVVVVEQVRKAMPDDIVDLIKVDGVWMTPEDAKRD